MICNGGLLELWGSQFTVLQLHMELFLGELFNELLLLLQQSLNVQSLGMRV